MKKTFLILVIVCAASVSFANPSVNEKVLKQFNIVFPSVQNVKWYEFDDFYQVYFDQGDVKCRIKYDLEGHIISTIRYYGESMVSPFLKAKLAQRFPDKKIFGVTELNSDNEITYDFVLEDEKNWMHVKSDAIGQMSVTEKFKKASE